MNELITDLKEFRKACQFGIQEIINEMYAKYSCSTPNEVFDEISERMHCLERNG